MRKFVLFLALVFALAGAGCANMSKTMLGGADFSLGSVDYKTQPQDDKFWQFVEALQPGMARGQVDTLAKSLGFDVPKFAVAPQCMFTLLETKGAPYIHFLKSTGTSYPYTLSVTQASVKRDLILNFDRNNALYGIAEYRYYADEMGTNWGSSQNNAVAGLLGLTVGFAGSDNSAMRNAPGFLPTDRLKKIRRGMTEFEFRQVVPGDYWYVPLSNIPKGDEMVYVKKGYDVSPSMKATSTPCIDVVHFTPKFADGKLVALEAEAFRSEFRGWQKDGIPSTSTSIGQKFPAFAAAFFDTVKELGGKVEYTKASLDLTTDAEKQAAVAAQAASDAKWQAQEDAETAAWKAIATPNRLFWRGARDSDYPQGTSAYKVTGQNPMAKRNYLLGSYTTKVKDFVGYWKPKVLWAGNAVLYLPQEAFEKSTAASVQLVPKANTYGLMPLPAAAKLGETTDKSIKDKKASGGRFADLLDAPAASSAVPGIPADLVPFLVEYDKAKAWDRKRIDGIIAASMAAMDATGDTTGEGGIYENTMLYRPLKCVLFDLDGKNMAALSALDGVASAVLVLDK